MSFWYPVAEIATFMVRLSLVKLLATRGLGLNIINGDDMESLYWWPGIVLIA